ncbi:MAG TPA: HAD family hydrolase [Thermoplasmata archaeon]|nr:HAD family hydrolase [Thermoplasmata archaeon]
MNSVGVPTVTFDLWYTLVFLDPREQDRYMDRQAEIAVRALQSAEPIPVDGPERKAGELRAAFLREVARATDAAADGESVPCSEQFRRAALSAGRAADPEGYLTELAKLLAATPLQPVPGSLECLETLRGAGYRLAVVSNTVGEPGRAFRPLLQGLGFDPFIETYVFSDELPWTKPNPEIFRRAMHLIGSTAAETVHVGDGWSDIEGARRAGLRAGILFTGHPPYTSRYRRFTLGRAGEPARSPLTAARLADVPELVRRLLPNGVGSPPSGRT